MDDRWEIWSKENGNHTKGYECLECSPAKCPDCEGFIHVKDYWDEYGYVEFEYKCDTCGKWYWV